MNNITEIATRPDDFKSRLERLLAVQVPNSAGLADKVITVLHGLAERSDTAARSGWYCPHCETGVRPQEVTFEEMHQACGTYIGMATPPPMGRSLDMVVLRAALSAAERDRDRFEAALFAIIFLCHSDNEVVALENISLIATAMIGGSPFDEVISHEQFSQ